jgi:hypothetical protein
MMRQLNPKDEQLLSDYLDGQMPARDAAAFEKRLKDDADLRQAAAEVRRLKVILRRAPRYSLPRNFMLTPAMVEKPRALLWVPVLRFASIAAVFLLAASFLLESLPGGVPALRANPAPAAPPAAAAAQAQASPPPIILWNGNPAYGRGGGEGPAEPAAAPSIMEAAPNQKQMDTAVQPTEGAQALMAPAEPLATPTIPGQEAFGLQAAPPLAAPMEAAPPAAAPAFAPTEPPSAPLPQVQPPVGAGGGPPAPETGAAQPAPPTQQPPAADLAPDAAPQVQNSVPTILGIRPTDERAMIVTEDGQQMDQSEKVQAAPQAAPEDNSTWNWIKLALALAALSTGTAAVLLRRKERK